MIGLLDLIPLIAFFVAIKKFGIFTAAMVLLVSTVGVYLIHLFKQKGKLTKQQWVTLVLTIFFCSLTLLLHDEYYIKVKSPILNAIFSATLLVSVLLNKPIIKPLLDKVFLLSHQGWVKMTLAWGYYFLVLALLHYYFGFMLPYDKATNNQIWGDFKSWGHFLVTIPFLLSQFYFLRNHLNPELEQQMNEKQGKK